jgi:uncharacterized protein
MAADVLQTLIRRYLQLGLPQSVFCWQGGEPTLAGLDFYQYAVTLMQRFGTAGQSVGNAFQTNGLLLDEDWCRFFTQYRFLVGLSLDGPAEIHDAYRGSAHADVMRAVRLLKDQSVEFNVLSVVTDRSAPQASRIYSYLRGLGVRHLQYIPCLEADPSGRAAAFSVRPEAYADFLCQTFDLWLPEAKEGASVRLFDALLKHALTGETGLCDFGGQCATYLVVERNGDAYPCDFFVAPEWRLGNVRTTPLPKLLDRSPARRLRQARRRLPDECASCEWRTLCAGGCLKDRSRLTARLDVPTFFCTANKRFLAHAVPRIRQLECSLRLRSGQGVQNAERRVQNSGSPSNVDRRGHGGVRPGGGRAG